MKYHLIPIAFFGSVLSCSLVNSSPFSLDAVQEFQINDPSMLIQVGEFYYKSRQFDHAVECFELAIYLLQSNENAVTREDKFKSLYMLFLSYAELSSPRMMERVVYQVLELIKPLQFDDSSLCRNLVSSIVLCSDRPDPPDFERGGCNYEREAQDYYNRAYELFGEAVEHAVNAAASIYIPPISVLEVYRSVDCFKEAAVEYNKGVAVEKQGGKK